jgi:hypothetical protein
MRDQHATHARGPQVNDASTIGDRTVSKRGREPLVGSARIQGPNELPQTFADGVEPESQTTQMELLRLHERRSFFVDRLLTRTPLAFAACRWMCGCWDSFSCSRS